MISSNNNDGNAPIIVYNSEFSSINYINSSNQKKGWGMGFYFRNLNIFNSNFFSIYNCSGNNIFESYRCNKGFSNYINLIHSYGLMDIIRSTTLWNITNSIFYSNSFGSIYIYSPSDYLLILSNCYFDFQPIQSGYFTLKSCFITKYPTIKINQLNTYLCEGNYYTKSFLKNKFKFQLFTFLLY